MERLNHHHLYIFWTVAKQGSFTKAAGQLRIAQSAVTAQIKALEESLEMQLIDRSNRRKPSLTDEGKKVVEYADSIFESSLELLKWARHGELAKAQRLRLGALSGLSRNLQYEFLRPALGKPGIHIEVTTGDQEKLVRLLREHALDVILSSHNVQPEGRVSFHSHVLTRSPLIFVAQNGLFKRGTTLKEALQGRPIYIPGQNFEARPELDAFLEVYRPQIAGEIDDIALLRIFALRSGAVVALPEMGVLLDVEEKALSVLGTAGKIEQRFYAITRQKKSPSRVVESLIASIRAS